MPTSLSKILIASLWFVVAMDVSALNIKNNLGSLIAMGPQHIKSFISEPDAKLTVNVNTSVKEQQPVRIKQISSGNLSQMITLASLHPRDLVSKPKQQQLAPATPEKKSIEYTDVAQSSFSQNVMKFAAKLEEQSSRLVIEKIDDNSIRFVPEYLELHQATEVITAKLMGFNASEIQFFARDEKAIEIAGTEIKILKRVDTELFALYNNKMFILPVIASDADQNTTQLIADNHSSEQQLEQSYIEETADKENYLPTTPIKKTMVSQEKSANQSISKKNQKAQENADSDPVAEIDSYYDAANRWLKETEVISDDDSGNTIKVRFMDRRSVPEADQIFALPGLRVWLIGAESEAVTTDVEGVAQINLPVGSKALLRFHDPLGRVRAGYKIVDSNSQLFDISLHPAKDLDLYSELLAIDSHRANGSFCAFIRNDFDTNEKLSGWRLEANDQGVEFLYFNEYGLPQPNQNMTSQNGKVCAFGLMEGPETFYFYDGDEYVGAKTISILANAHHTEFDFYMDEAFSLEVSVSAYGTTPELLSENAILNQGLIPIEYARFTPVASGISMPVSENSANTLVWNTATDAHDGMIYAMNQSAEFEPTLYQFDSLKSQHLAPMFRRGFLEEMAFETGVNYDARMGSLIAEFSSMEAGIELSIVNSSGEIVRQTVDMSRDGIIRVLALDLDYGVYHVVLKNQQGNLLQTRVANVYDATLSYISLN